MPTMMPLMDKDTVRYITQNITPEEAEYVAGIKSTIDDTKVMETTPEKCDDIIYLTKIIAFATKFKTTCSWCGENIQYQSKIQDFQWRIDQYKEDISEIIQSIIGTIKGSDITKIELPISDNPLEVINELKQCVQNWFILHRDDIEYEGARSLTSNFLSQIQKYVYIFRLCKISTAGYADDMKLPNPDAGTIICPNYNINY
ncbi:MAG: hypothetical protein [Hatfieldvirus porci]|uniref:Uncharacterized protein n=1 Tax=phage Lak_Megaphage_RVC_JS4_GC31 TaxID=3109228 RepID=A0ABZ0Z4I3_9CAUD|nr:MAG: hypothetical protein [phage Lak_Megaphage_RVC_AP3_GC31]WQJ53065.1 MAG: hypothetical protein [phage Lak_Megaphage_RVC_JS4_GC31]